MDKPLAIEPVPSELSYFWQNLTETIQFWRSRKNYLSNPVNQYRMMRQFLVIFAIGTGLGMLNMYVIKHIARSLSSQVGAISMSNAYIYGILGVCIVVWVGISIAAFYTCMLIFSHRIMGAAYRLQQTLQRLAAGDLKVHVQLRQRDYLHELANEINVVARTYDKGFNDLDRTVAELRAAHAAGGDIEAPLLAAEQVLQHYRNHLAQ